VYVVRSSVNVIASAQDTVNETEQAEGMKWWEVEDAGSGKCGVGRFQFQSCICKNKEEWRLVVTSSR
jgi:hypothetical protein